MLRYLADPQLRPRHRGHQQGRVLPRLRPVAGVRQQRRAGRQRPAEQEKLIKFNTLLANLVIFHNALDIMDVVRGLVAEGWTVTVDQLAALSPHLRGHITRFGAYATDELGRHPGPSTPC